MVAEKQLKQNFKNPKSSGVFPISNDNKHSVLVALFHLYANNCSYGTPCFTEMPRPGDSEETFGNPLIRQPSAHLFQHTAETLMFNVKKSYKYQFLVFGLTRPRIEPVYTVSCRGSINKQATFCYKYCWNGKSTSGPKKRRGGVGRVRFKLKRSVSLRKMHRNAANVFCELVPGLVTLRIFCHSLELKKKAQ